MAYYVDQNKNVKKVLSVVKNTFKGGLLNATENGAYLPSDYGLEAFTYVNVFAPDTPTEAMKYIAGDSSVTYWAFGENVTSIAMNFQQFPNLETIYIQNTDHVIDIASNAWNGTKVLTTGKINVANTLLNDYKTRYPAWASVFDSWRFENAFEIPFIGETTLTRKYVENVIRMTGGSIAGVNKVIVPVDFTEYESGAIQSIIDNFPSLSILETCYENGNIDLDMNGDIVAKIVEIGKSVDEALVHARSMTIISAGTTNRLSLGDEKASKVIIVPPLPTVNYAPSGSPYSNIFNGLPNLVMIAHNAINELSSGNVHTIKDCNNLVSIDLTFTNGSLTYFEFYYQPYSSPALKEILLNNYKLEMNLSNSTLLTREALINLFNSLGTPSSTKTLTLGSTNLNKLTTEDIAIATNKNWTLA